MADTTQADVRCSFCGNSRRDVRTIVAGRESAICDVCAVTAFEVVASQPSGLHLRVAYAIFRAVVWFPASLCSAPPFRLISTAAAASP